MSTSVIIHIDGIVFEELSPFEARLAGQAFATELGKMFEIKGLPDFLARNTAVQTLSLEGFEIPPAARPQAIGRELARAVYGGLRA